MKFRVNCVSGLDRENENLSPIIFFLITVIKRKLNQFAQLNPNLVQNQASKTPSTLELNV